MSDALAQLCGIQGLLRHLERHRVYIAPLGLQMQLREEEEQLWLEWSRACYALESGQ